MSGKGSGAPGAPGNALALALGLGAALGLALAFGAASFQILQKKKHKAGATRVQLCVLKTLGLNRYRLQHAWTELFNTRKND